MGTITITTDMELFAAALLQHKVSVWAKQNGRCLTLLDKDGFVENITPDMVKVRYPQKQCSEYYLRCEFVFQVHS